MQELDFNELVTQHTEQPSCNPKDHEWVRDAFAAISSVKRHMQGNMFCLTCKKPVPATH